MLYGDGVVVVLVQQLVVRITIRFVAEVRDTHVSVGDSCICIQPIQHNLQLRTAGGSLCDLDRLPLRHLVLGVAGGQSQHVGVKLAILLRGTSFRLQDIYA